MMVTSRIPALMNNLIIPVHSTTAVVDVLDQHRFDEAGLERHMATHVAEFTPPLTVRQYQGGMSNPTFLLSDSNRRRTVLRMKPPGKLLPSAHAVDREYHVITALGPTDVPVPETYTLC
jgi:aminoglycoside phosphotransferase (APT) family kinase protein